MAFKLGQKATVGIGPESTYGTAVTPTDFTIFNSESLKKDVQKMPIEAICGAGYIPQLVSLGQTVTGDLVFPVNADDIIGLIIKSFMGQVPTDAQQGTTSAYKHTFLGTNDWVADGSKGCGLTIQVNRDSTAQDYSGCLPSVLKFAVAPNNLLICTASFVGQNAASQGSPTSATFSTQPPLIFSQGVVTYDSGAIAVVSAEVTLDNRVVADTFKLGQSTIVRPAMGGRMITGNITIRFEDTTVYDAFIANTNHELKLTFTGAVISGAYAYALVITLGKIYFTNNPTPNISGKGVIIQNCPFVSIYDDATDQDVKIELTNTIVSYPNS